MTVPAVPTEREVGVQRAVTARPPVHLRVLVRLRVSTPTHAKPGENGSTSRAQFYSSYEDEVKCNTSTRCRLQSWCSAKCYLWAHI